MNLYQVVLGEYSDRSEQWFSHALKMNKENFFELLITTWNEVTKPRAESYFHTNNTTEVLYLDYFEELMSDAGFVKLTPVVSFTISPPWRNGLNGIIEFEKELLENAGY